MLSLLWVASLSLSTTAAAYLYDDFNTGTTIDTAKWIMTNDPSSGTFFTQSGGLLSFSADHGAGGLVSTRTFGPGFFSMEFYNFDSNNMQPPNSHEGAFAALGLTIGVDKFVRIIRCQNGDPLTNQVYGVFEVNFKVGTDLKVYYVPTTVNEGRLGMYYDGTTVTFFFDDGSGWQNTGWIESGTHIPWSGEWAPGWISDPKLFIRGYDMTYATSFSADNVEYCPVPEPCAAWLLVSGLVGLAALRRRMRKGSCGFMAIRP
jgi:hypothetical protein